MKDLPKTAYELEPLTAQLDTQQQRQAILWWQQQTPYTPLFCPSCGEKLALSETEIGLSCPQVWCPYTTDEIPWVVYAAWLRFG